MWGCSRPGYVLLGFHGLTLPMGFCCSGQEGPPPFGRAVLSSPRQLRFVKHAFRFPSAPFLYLHTGLFLHLSSFGRFLGDGGMGGCFGESPKFRPVPSRSTVTAYDYTLLLTNKC